VPGITGEASEDLLQCAGSFASTTTCAWSYYFEGSDVALTTGNENVDGAAILNGDVYLTTTGAFTTSDPPGPPTSLSGGGEDVFSCNGGSRGATTTCSSFSLFFDGSANGLNNNLDAIDLP